MEIRYSRFALKFLKKADSVLRKRIVNGIKGLTQKPPQGDIKHMQGVDKYRLRIGKYRIIYNYLNENYVEILYIENIDSRGGIYK